MKKLLILAVITLMAVPLSRTMAQQAPLLPERAITLPTVPHKGTIPVESTPLSAGTSPVQESAELATVGYAGIMVIESCDPMRSVAMPIRLVNSGNTSLSFTEIEYPSSLRLLTAINPAATLAPGESIELVFAPEQRSLAEVLGGSVEVRACSRAGQIRIKIPVVRVTAWCGDNAPALLPAIR